MKWDEVLEMAPAEAWRHFDMPEAPMVNSLAEAIVFREDAPDLALAAE